MLNLKDVNELNHCRCGDCAHFRITEISNGEDIVEQCLKQHENVGYYLYSNCTDYVKL